MNLMEVGENQELYEAEKTTIMEKLSQLDPSSDEYTTAMQNLYTLDNVAENERKSAIAAEELKQNTKRTVLQVGGSIVGSLAGIAAIMFGETIMDKIFTSKAMGWVRKP